MQQTPIGLGAAVHRASEVFIGIVRLNLLWVLGTLAGGVVFGVGPATVAAYHVAWSEQRGEGSRPWREFTDAYRSHFLAGNVLYLPIGIAAMMLAADARWSAQLPATTGSVVRWILLALAVALAGAAVHLGPAFVHLDVSSLTCLRRVGALALSQLPTTILLLVLLNAWVQILAAVPLVALLGGAGGWIRVSSELCRYAYRRTTSTGSTPVVPAPRTTAPGTTAPGTTTPSITAPSVTAPSIPEPTCSGRMTQTKES